MLDFSEVPIEATVEELEEQSVFIGDFIDSSIVEENKKKSIERYKDRPKSLGASRIGFPLGDDFFFCARALYFEYKNYPKRKDRDFSADLYRVFDMGHDAEERIASYIRKAGFSLLTHKRDGYQFGFNLFPCPETGHYRIKGFLDGIVSDGPENITGYKFAEHDGFTIKYPFLWECKAVKNSKWKAIKKHGLKKEASNYYAQVQIYMGVKNLIANPAMVTVLNRDTGALHFEFIDYVEKHAQICLDRGITVISANHPGELPRATRDYNQMPCQGCPYIDDCKKIENVK